MVTVLGMDVSKDVRAVKERIGVQPQTPALFPTLNVREIADFFGSLYSRAIPSDEAIEMVFEGLASVEGVWAEVNHIYAEWERKMAVYERSQDTDKAVLARNALYDHNPLKEEASFLKDRFCDVLTTFLRYGTPEQKLRAIEHIKLLVAKVSPLMVKVFISMIDQAMSMESDSEIVPQLKALQESLEQHPARHSISPL